MGAHPGGRGGGVAGRATGHTLIYPAQCGGADAAAWTTRAGLTDRIQVHAGSFELSVRPDAVIIANRATVHVAAAKPVLAAGLPLLIEKPMAMGADQVRGLQRQAQAGDALLAASHVFLFARYLENFAAQVARAGPILDFELDWQDARGEMVRGEIKGL